MINISQEEIMQNWGVENSDNPLVSVRCITYNHEFYIGQALDGFLMQKTNFPFEVIVHDDASTDKTADIIHQYEIKYPKLIKPIYEKENQWSKHDGSLSRIVNFACKGKYIAFCEGDDYWINENKLQMQVDFLEKNTSFSAYYSNVKIINSDKGDIDISEQFPELSMKKERIYYKKDPNCINLIGQLGSLVCINVYKTLSNDELQYYYNCYSNGDRKLSVLLNGLGDVFFSGSQLSVYRKTNSTTSWSSKNKNKNLFLHSFKTYISLNELAKKLFSYQLNIQCYLKRLYVGSFLISKRNDQDKEIFKTIKNLYPINLNIFELIIISIQIFFNKIFKRNIY